MHVYGKGLLADATAKDSMLDSNASSVSILSHEVDLIPKFIMASGDLVLLSDTCFACVLRQDGE